MNKELKKIDLFETQERITINRISERYDALQAVASFKCETDEHRDARMALFFNLDNYKRAVNVAKDMLEQPSKEIKEFNQEKHALAKRCGGTEQQLQNGSTQVVGITDTQKYSEELAKLEMKYKSVIQEEYKRQARNNELLNREPSRIPEPHYADPKWFPDTITPDKLAGISFMLKDMENQAEEVEEKDTKPKRTKKK